MSSSAAGTRDASKAETVIGGVYYDVATGFGSIAKTLEQARKLDPTITRDDVRAFLAKQEHRQGKRRRKDNSWVPFGPREEFQVDLADFGAESDYRFALLAIDVFTKKLVVVPIKSKSSEATAAAMDVVLSELDVPNYVYTDDGGEFQAAFDDKLSKYLVEHVVSRTPATFVERAIRTLRDGIAVRMEALSLPKKDWWKMAKPVVDQYNATPHTTTKMKPNDAANLDWDEPGGRERILQIRATIEGKAHFDRKYPEISVGDRVKVLRKPGKYGEFKSGFVAWTRETFEVKRIAYEAETPVFYLEGRPRPLRLHEILKVEDVQKAPKRKVEGKQPPQALLRSGGARPGQSGPAAGSGSAGSSSAAGSSAAPAAAARTRLRTKTYNPQWHRQQAVHPVARARVRAKTFDPEWHRLHPLGGQILS